MVLCCVIVAVACDRNCMFMGNYLGRRVLFVTPCIILRYLTLEKENLGIPARLLNQTLNMNWYLSRRLKKQPVVGVV